MTGGVILLVAILWITLIGGRSARMLILFTGMVLGNSALSFIFDVNII